MTKWIETTGKSEEAAIAAALAQLGLERDDVSVELLCRAKTGFLGIGSTPAKVRVSYEAPDEESAAPAPVEEEKTPAPQPRKAQPVKEKKPREKKAPREVQASAPVRTEAVKAPPAPKAEAAETPAPTGEAALRAQAFLTGLLEHMDSQARPVITEGADGILNVELVGEHLGALIGRRGETLDAIQQLTNYAVNHGQSKRVRIYLDAEHYRSRREESLQRLAVKMAGKVVKYRKNVMLEPMNAYERHVIHAALQDTPNVTTYSTGTEPNRRIVVAYTRD